MVEKTMLVDFKDSAKLQELVKACGLYFRNFKKPQFHPQFTKFSVIFYGEAEQMMEFNRRWDRVTTDIKEIQQKSWIHQKLYKYFKIKL